MTKQELTELIASEEIELSDVIDIVIELNGIIGVGLISFGEACQEYINGKISKVS
tara:strand:- start:481 stop:645 length:165 start_codon:yes stop_codon:yes gene_type:complete